MDSDAHTNLFNFDIKMGPIVVHPPCYLRVILQFCLKEL